MHADEQILSQSAEEPIVLPQEFDATQDSCRCRELRLIAEKSHRLYFIPVCDVDYIEAYGNYVRIHVGESEYVRRDTLERLTRELRGSGFMRVHRSTLLNFRRVAFAERLGDGAFAFTLTSGARLASRTRFRLKESQSDS
jgi:two-component system LytT family response regulator